MLTTKRDADPTVKTIQVEGNDEIIIVPTKILYTYPEATKKISNKEIFFKKKV